MVNIFPVEILFQKIQNRNVLKWSEHILALQADKYGGKALKKAVRQAVRRILLKQ